ncbi:hypothetical protein H0X10_03370 [Candidatus Saccharibacteria bacterium]|nr:hypothetical protein [Candidatus Saccharibacteria bacterium]
MNPNNQQVPNGLPPTGVQPGQEPFQQPQAASQMKKHFNVLIIPLVLFVLFFFGALGFGVWAFGERNTFKNETDKIVAKEVVLTEQRVKSEKDKEFVESEKRPTKRYTGPALYGSVELEYPKTWSAFITEGESSTPIDGYLHPDFVPGTRSGTSFALRVEVVQRSYDSELKQYESKVKSGKLAITPFRAEQVPGVLGARVEGEINTGQKDIMVLFPLRDKTLKISTESETFYGDFNSIILKTLKFVP